MMDRLAPRGQSLVELVAMLGIFSALLAMTMLIGVVGDQSIRASGAARLAAFDCDLRPGFCRVDATDTQTKVRTLFFSSDLREVLTKDAPEMREFSALRSNRQVIEKFKDVRLGVDLPRVDGADKNLLDKLATAFRSLSLKAGPGIFGLPSPDQLTRSTVTTVLWDSHGSDRALSIPRLQMQNRVALISDSWSASDRNDFVTRSRNGESPLALLGNVIDWFYMPGKDLLMPVTDFVGLESNTRSFRDGYHRVDYDLPYANSRARTN